MKTAELIGLPLNWAVMKCECAIPAAFKSAPVEFYGTIRVFRIYTNAHSEPVSPSTNWAHGGPIIERERMSVEYYNTDTSDSPWSACSAGGKYHFGPTLLIAAMRCYVASNLGDEVEIPKGLK
jgi:hypothetical protein